MNADVKETIIICSIVLGLVVIVIAVLGFIGRTRECPTCREAYQRSRFVLRIDDVYDIDEVETKLRNMNISGQFYFLDTEEIAPRNTDTGVLYNSGSIFWLENGELRWTRNTREWTWNPN